MIPACLPGEQNNSAKSSNTTQYSLTDFCWLIWNLQSECPQVTRPDGNTTQTNMYRQKVWEIQRQSSKSFLLREKRHCEENIYIKKRLIIKKTLNAQGKIIKAEHLDGWSFDFEVWITLWEYERPCQVVYSSLWLA